MRKIQFGGDTQPLRLDWPTEWDPTVVTSVDLKILDRNGSELLAADACTLYAGTTTDGDTEQYEDVVTLIEDSDPLPVGVLVRLTGTEGTEIQKVTGYASLVVEFERSLENAYPDGSTVAGLYADYTLDASDAAVFPVGRQLTFIWTPDAGQEVHEIGEVVGFSATQIAGFEKRFRAVYPRAWNRMNVDGTFDDIKAEADNRLRLELKNAGLNIDRLQNQDALAPSLMATMAYLWVLQADGDKADERASIVRDRAEQIKLLLSLPEWKDDDQDNIEDRNEINAVEWDCYGGY